MNSIKCKNCGLSNFPSDVECRRCKYSFIQSTANKRQDKPPRSFSIWRLVMLAVALGVGYYLYSAYFAAESSANQININETKRAGSQPSTTSGLSRTENDRQRSGHYGDALRNSSSLKAHEQRVKETEKAAQQISNSR